MQWVEETRLWDAEASETDGEILETLCWLSHRCKQEFEGERAPREEQKQQPPNQQHSMRVRRLSNRCEAIFEKLSSGSEPEAVGQAKTTGVNFAYIPRI